MSDLISRSELIEELKESLDDTALQNSLEFFGVYDIIRSQPTVEAIPKEKLEEIVERLEERLTEEAFSHDELDGDKYYLELDEAIEIVEGVINERD